MEITLPIYDWFTAEFDRETGRGNMFSGSVGTDNQIGSLSRRLFEYNAVMIRTEHEDAEGKKKKVVTLHVTCGLRLPWPQGAAWSQPQEADFPGTQDGIDQAVAWLAERQAALTKG